MSYDPQAGEITGLLTAWDDGDLGARNRLFHIVYPKLRHQARSMLLRYRHRASLEAGDIVSEVYLRLASRRDGRWKNSGQFLAVTRKLSHSVLIDEVRFRLRQKRGGREQPVPLADASPPATDHRADDVITRQALADLRQVDPLAARVCRLRFERGMTYEETADAVGTSRATVGRAQKFARAWLRKRLAGAANDRGERTDGSAEEPSGRIGGGDRRTSAARARSRSHETRAS